jgi:hypothetical protein
MLSAGAAWAGEVTADVNTDVSLLSNYVWRGQNLGEDGVIQPNLSIGFGYGLSLGVWANYNIDDDRYSSSHQVNEVDYTIDYSRDLGPVGISLGVIYYDFPRTGGFDTQEWYAGVTANILLSPTLTVYRDFHEFDGTYIALGIGHDIELNEQAALSLGASLGWGSESYHNGYFGVKDDSLSDYNLSASVAFAVSDKITVTPMLSYSGFTDNDIEDAADLIYDEDSIVYGGVNVSYSF